MGRIETRIDVSHAIVGAHGRPPHTNISDASANSATTRPAVSGGHARRGRTCGRGGHGAAQVRDSSHERPAPSRTDRRRDRGADRQHHHASIEREVRPGRAPDPAARRSGAGSPIGRSRVKPSAPPMTESICSRPATAAAVGRGWRRWPGGCRFRGGGPARAPASGRRRLRKRQSTATSRAAPSVEAMAPKSRVNCARKSRTNGVTTLSLSRESKIGCCVRSRSGWPAPS